jgi:putative photosynthetic complex assembly protein 2
MEAYGIAVAYTIFLWWASTGVILYLDGLPRGTFRWSMLGATAMLAAGLVGIQASADDASMLGAYCAFTCAILAWAWVETSFLTGFITGPSDRPCPADARGFARFRLAVRAILWHELAILAAGAAILALTWGQPNQIGLWTYAALLLLRLSAKLNLYLGARNLGEHLLPDHLKHLASFFRRRPMNLLFPVSITLATIACALVLAAGASAAEEPVATGFALLGVLLALGVLEHWFLMLPIPFERLWAWSLRGRGVGEPPARDANSFATTLPVPCHAATLRQVLQAAADGDFGEVEHLDGLVRNADAAGWIRFQLSGGRAGLAALGSAEGEEPRVTATGRRLDGARLRAALQARALPAPLPA